MHYRELQELINLKHEGGYWDFKREWHHSKTDLLHDIICMANNLENRDAYIIIGVDEDNDFLACDISNDANRRNTQKLTDFLKDKKFAGGIRPLVHVETFMIDNASVDVIVVENSKNTPFFLTEKYDGVFPHQIYTRVQETNTPTTSSADINHIEYLWKKRFHLLDSPIEKFSFYLSDCKNWIEMPNEYVQYYKTNPEYVIEIENDDRDGYEYYLFNQMDPRPHWSTIRLKYYNTVLIEYSGIALDGGRYFSIAPRKKIISYNRNDFICFCYFTKDSLEYRVHEFYYRSKYEGSDESIAHRQFMESILIFETGNQLNEFMRYVKPVFKEYSCTKRHLVPHINLPSGYKDDAFQKDWTVFFKLSELYEQFISSLSN